MPERIGARFEITWTLCSVLDMHCSGSWLERDGSRGSARERLC